MNPPGKRPWSADAQALNLLLCELQLNPPAGWRVNYELADDAPRDDGLDNRELFAAEQRERWGQTFRDRHVRLKDQDAAEDLAAMPSAGHHVLLELVHEETDARVYRWVDREELIALARDATRTRAQKLADLRAHANSAIAGSSARVARARQRLEAAGAGRRGQ
jgi:Mg/Co/Ni transporter MgtE